MGGLEERQHDNGVYWRRNKTDWKSRTKDTGKWRLSMACWSKGMAGGYAGYQSNELIADKHLSKLEGREGCASARLAISRFREEALSCLSRALVGRARCSGEGLLNLSQIKSHSKEQSRSWPQ
jgi:hypothetical protein